MKCTFLLTALLLSLCWSAPSFAQTTPATSKEIAKEVTPYFVAIGFEKRFMRGDTLVLQGVDRVIGKAPHCDGFESNSYSTIKYRESTGQIWFVGDVTEQIGGCSLSIMPVDTALNYIIYYVKIGDERSYLYNNFSGQPVAPGPKKKGK